MCQSKQKRVTGNVDIKRIVRLSQPRHKPCPERDPNIIAESALEYVATERIVSLAQPRKEKTNDTVYGMPCITLPPNPQFASFKSHGIDKLAQLLHPREKFRKVTVDVRCSAVMNE